MTFSDVIKQTLRGGSTNASQLAQHEHDMAAYLDDSSECEGLASFAFEMEFHEQSTLQMECGKERSKSQLKTKDSNPDSVKDTSSQLLAIAGSFEDTTEDPFVSPSEVLNTQLSASSEAGARKVSRPRRSIVDDEDYTHAWASISTETEQPVAEWMEQYFMFHSPFHSSSPILKSALTL